MFTLLYAAVACLIIIKYEPDSLYIRSSGLFPHRQIYHCQIFSIRTRKCHRFSSHFDEMFRKFAYFCCAMFSHWKTIWQWNAKKKIRNKNLSFGQTLTQICQQQNRPQNFEVLKIFSWENGIWMYRLEIRMAGTKHKGKNTLFTTVTLSWWFLQWKSFQLCIGYGTGSKANVLTHKLCTACHKLTPIWIWEMVEKFLLVNDSACIYMKRHSM